MRAAHEHQRALAVVGMVGLLLFGGPSGRAQADCAGPEDCVCPMVAAYTIIKATAREAGLFRVDEVIVSPRAINDAGAPASTPPVVGDEIDLGRPLEEARPGSRWVIGLRPAGVSPVLRPLTAEGRMSCATARETIDPAQLPTITASDEPCQAFARQLTARPCDDTRVSCAFAGVRGEASVWALLGLPLSYLFARRLRRART